MDIAWLSVTVGFFAVTSFLVRFIDKLREEA